MPKFSIWELTYTYELYYKYLKQEFAVNVNYHCVKQRVQTLHKRNLSFSKNTVNEAIYDPFIEYSVSNVYLPLFTHIRINGITIFLNYPKQIYIY